MRVLIIEDERECARYLADELRELRPRIDIAGTVSDIEGAIRMISEHKDLDIIFADIKLDDGMSFRIFEQVNTEAMVVFTTAYDEFALKAFDYNCVDYLLKPVSAIDLERALIKCENRNARISPDILRQISTDIISGNVGYRKRLVIEKGADLVIRDVDDLCYALTEGGYVTAFFKDIFKSMINDSLTSLSESLDSRKFMRINRQVLVNLACVDRISHGDGRDYAVKLRPPYSAESFAITAETKKALLQRLQSFAPNISDP